MNRKYINIGCGSIHHPKWINLDVSPVDPEVLKVDITKGLPFLSNSVDACYNSHVLEHIDRNDAKQFIADCFRVLKPGGIIRIVVPDLEKITREYLRILDFYSREGQLSDFEYDWILLEMYDQTVRDKSGGKMATFLKNVNDENKDYIKNRIGFEANFHNQGERKVSRNFLESARIKITKSWFSIRIKFAGLFVLFIAGKSAYENYNVGIFRGKGEIHRWMYDRYSLTRLLEQVGFADVRICEASESRIPAFDSYSLDSINNVIRKPDSLFIEGSKP